MAKLARSVFVRDPDKHQDILLRKGETPAAKYAALVTNPACWEGGKLPAAVKKHLASGPEGDGGNDDADAGQDDANGDDSAPSGDADQSDTGTSTQDEPAEDTKPAAKKTAARKSAASKTAAS